MKNRVLSPVIQVLVFAALLLGLSLTARPVVALADDGEAQGRTVTIYTDGEMAGVSDKVLDAFSDPDVMTVRVLDRSLMESGSDASRPVTPCWDNYSVRNKRYNGVLTGSSVLARATGLPGMTVSISQTCSVSNSYSCSVSGLAPEISACVGFSVTKTNSITVSGSDVVPYTHRSKDVSSMTLIAHPTFEYYSYDVYFGSACVGSGTANKAIGVSFSRSFSYK